jgi:4'-phosphopantetheinyl transferase
MVTASAAAAATAIATGDVHVWRIGLDRSDTSQLGTVLSPDERTRAARFYFERDRARFVVARAALRHILGDYLGIPPAEMAFVYGTHGKPSLAAPWFDLCFNLSHSRAVGLCAVTRGRAIGVDVEQIRPLDDADALAEHLFSPRERASLRRLSGERKLRGFFNAWTRKEAFIKALGDGLSHPLESFDVSLAPGAPARLESIDGDPVAAARWSLSALDVDPVHPAAVVVAGHTRSVTVRCWPGDSASA